LRVDDVKNEIAEDLLERNRWRRKRDRREDYRGRSVKLRESQPVSLKEQLREAKAMEAFAESLLEIAGR
jgi:hypothetical protein